jgi:hypothetical protein
MRFSDRLQVQVSVNGVSVEGLIRASIATTNTFSADTYSLTFASRDVAFWSLVASASIEVTAVVASAYGAEYRTLITGLADTIHIDPVRGIIAVEGRDYSSSMVDSYRQQDFVNQTAAEIVGTIAASHGLQPIVWPTVGIIGRYYSDGYTKLSLGQFSRLQSDWDLVVHLARQNGFDVFVQNRSLYFQPSSPSTSAPIPVFLQDLRSARLERNLNIAAGTPARVQSWNSQNMAAYSSDGPGNALLPPADDARSSLPFLFSGSNYTSRQVTESAERYASELTRLGTVLVLDMPWDFAFTPRATCVLLNTGSTFDTTYQIETVERHYSSTSGSDQVVRAIKI